MPPLSSRSRSASTGRAERMGPTTAASWHWNVTKNRVRPPSTTSSVTMSALLRPIWGSADGALSTLTERAGRFTLAGVTAGSPVRGQRGAPGGAVAAVEPVVVVAGAVVVVGPAAT